MPQWYPDCRSLSSGRHTSIEALDRIVDDRGFETLGQALEWLIRDADPAEGYMWVKPYLDKALAALDRGEGIPGEEIDAGMRVYLATRHRV